jgi:hypothetical protein
MLGWGFINDAISTTDITWVGKVILNGETVIIWKVAIVAYFK